MTWSLLATSEGAEERAIFGEMLGQTVKALEGGVLGEVQRRSERERRCSVRQRSDPSTGPTEVMIVVEQNRGGRRGPSYVSRRN